MYQTYKRTYGSFDSAYEFERTKSTSGHNTRVFQIETGEDKVEYSVYWSLGFLDTDKAMKPS